METGKKKAKQSFSVPSVKSNVVPDKEKKAPCFDKNNCKKELVDEKSREAEGISLKQKKLKKQSPAADGDVPKPRKVVGKSLTDEEYDEIFMAVLQSVSSAERRGEVSDDSDDKEDLIQEESDKDDRSSEVIKVIVKVEETEDQKDFDYMENEDIDNWDNKASLSRDKKEKENNVEQTPPPEIQFTKPDSTFRDTVTTLAFCTKSAKTPKDKQASKRKDICSDKLHPTSTSDSKKVKKTSSHPRKIGKDKNICEKKESMKPETSLNKNVKVKKVRHKQKTSLKKKMSEREFEDIGTWVQCVNSYCLKWRYLPNVSDPMALPDRWECRMNTVEALNSCEKPEEKYDESEHIFTKYTEGSVVLAKMAGYPWWPAMIEIDPDYEAYYEVGHPTSMLPTKYHVVFFDKIVSRAWINIASIKPFTEIDVLPRKCKGHDYTREVKIATDNANAALELPLKERLKKYSFSARFSGKWGNLKSDTDLDNTKEERKMSKVSRCSKKRKIEQEDNLVDDKTLNQILNNSQSVLSDVAGMLDSMENDYNSNADSEYQVSQPETTVKKVKTEGDDADLQVSDARFGDSESMKEAAKFEVAKLDMDIFTMELGSVQLESQDQLNTDVQGDDCCSAGKNLALPDSVITGNIDETGTAELLEPNSAGKKNKSQKKKSAEVKDKKQDKPIKPKTSGEHDVCVGEEIIKKKKKKIKGDGTANKCPEANLEKSKKKTKKEQKTGDFSNRTPGEDNVEVQMQDKMEGKKSDKSLKCNGGDGKPKTSALGMCGYNKMKMKNISKEKKEGNTPEIKTGSVQRQNMDLELKTTIGQDKKTKKKKSKFINPVHAAKDKVSNTLNSDKKSGDKEDNTEDKKYMNSGNALIKPTSQRSQKEKVSHKEIEQDMSDDELNLEFNIPVRSTVDKVDSDEDDFMLDEPNTAIHRSAVVTQEEDSDPLDFEE